MSDEIRKGKIIEVGDIVRLRTGGPQMTVSMIDRPDGTATCAWFYQEDGQWIGPFHGTFGAAALVPVAV